MIVVRSLTPATWDTAGRRITASFLYNATRSLFEEAGFLGLVTVAALAAGAWLLIT